MSDIRIVFRNLPHDDLFKIGTGGSLLAVFSQLFNPDFMLTTVATLSGIAVAGLSCYKVWLEIKINRKKLRDLNHFINQNNEKDAD